MLFLQLFTYRRGERFSRFRLRLDFTAPILVVRDTPMGTYKTKLSVFAVMTLLCVIMLVMLMAR